MMWTCVGYVPNDEIISLKPTHPRVTTRTRGAKQDGVPCMSKTKGGGGFTFMVAIWVEEETDNYKHL